MAHATTGSSWLRPCSWVRAQYRHSANLLPYVATHPPLTLLLRKPSLTVGLTVRLIANFNEAPLTRTRIDLSPAEGTLVIDRRLLQGGQTLTFTKEGGRHLTAITTTPDRALASVATTAGPPVRQIFTVTKTGDQAITAITVPPDPASTDPKVDATRLSESSDGASATLTTTVGECGWFDHAGSFLLR